MKIKRVIPFVLVLIVFVLIPYFYSLRTNFFGYFVTYKEYFKTMVPAIFTCSAIISTWLLSKYQNERDIQKKQQERLENNRPKFLFKNYLNTDLIATVKDGNSFLKNFFLVGIDTEKKFFNLQMKPYILIKDISVSNILYKDFIIYYITSENEFFICLYQDNTFTYYNLASAKISENQVLVRFLDRVNKFPIFDDKEYNNNDVLSEDMKSIVDKVKVNEINEACISLLYFIRLYRTELSQDFIVEKLGIIKFVLMFNQYKCRSYSNIEYFKGNLHPSKTDKFNQTQMKYLENTNKIGIEFILQYMDDVISEINSHNIQKLDDFILRNIEIYIQDSTDTFTINYETKKELVHFESIKI